MHLECLVCIDILGGLEGHVSRDCTMEQKAKSCYKCGQEGHIVRSSSFPYPPLIPLANFPAFPSLFFLCLLSPATAPKTLVLPPAATAAVLVVSVPPLVVPPPALSATAVAKSATSPVRAPRLREGSVVLAEDSVVGTAEVLGSVVDSRGLATRVVVWGI